MRFDRYILAILIKYHVIISMFVTIIAMLTTGFRTVKRYPDAAFSQLIINELIAMPIKVNNMLGISLVAASIVTVMLLMRKKEMLAFISIGIHTARLLWPFILFAIIIAFITISFEYKIYPRLKAAQNRYIAEVLKKQPYKNTDRLVDVWMIDSGSCLIHIGVIDPINKTIMNITEYVLNESFEITSMRIIEYAYYSGNVWVLNNVENVSLTAIPPQKQYQREVSEHSPFFNNLTSLSGKNRKELAPADISKMIRVMRNHGLNAVNYEMLLYAIYANAFSVIILVMLVVPIGMDFSREYSPLLSSIKSFTLALAFWGVSAATNSFGYSGIMSPLKANFAPHIIFLIIGIILLLRQERAH